MDLGADEPGLVAALLCGTPTLSRNRHYELLSSELGRRARRRVAFLRSIARDIERVRQKHGAIVLERGTFARGEMRIVFHHQEFVRRAYLTLEEMSLIARVFPLVARVFDVNADP